MKNSEIFFFLRGWHTRRNIKKRFFSSKVVWLVLILCAVLYVPCSIADTKDKQVRIGVLSLRGANEAIERWTSNTKYLNAQIPDHTFSIVPLNFDEINKAVENGDIDFVFTNPGIYIEVEYKYGVDRIATLQDLWQGQSFDQFGGVIFTRKDQNDIKKINDLKNKSFIAVNEISFGGWRMAQRELKAYGIDPYRDFAELQFAGTHDKVVYAVQSGQIAAGVVRTGILEKMNEEGKINIENFTVLDQQHPDNFSLLISTRLYPEWPFAKVQHTSDQLAQDVSIALLRMASNSQAARDAGIAGWTIPHHYQLVHDCLKELRVSPYKDIGKITFSNLIQQYWGWMLTGIIAVIGLVTVTVYISGLNRKLNTKTIELKESYDKLEGRVEERTDELKHSNQQLIRENKDRKQAEAELRIERNNLKNIFEAMEDGVYIVNQNYDIQYVNPALVNDFGPYENHKCYAYFNDRDDVCPWCKILDVFMGKSVRWEWYSPKNGKTYDLVDTPLKNIDGSISKLEIFRDITARKQAEDELNKNRDQLEEKVRERTAELQTIVNAMAGREIKMADLKNEIERLKSQLEEAGLRPIPSQPSTGKN